LAGSNGVVAKGARLRRLVAADERLVARVRSGDPEAFAELYKRHCGELLSFCAYVLGSRHDAEDAVQTTFSAAYRALLAHERPIALRPWLFTIARNDCLSIMRKRRPEVELNGEPALRGDPYRELEVREEVRHTIKSLLELPEDQRAALVLAEMHGLSQSEIGSVLGVRSDQVKAFIYQARSHLISDRRAREADCREIREELASARGAALLRGRLRRHLRSCDGCRKYADGVSSQRRQFGFLLPLTPSLVLKYRALEHVVASGRSAAPVLRAGGAAGGSLAAAAEFVGGVPGAVKVAVACLGASACVGAGVLVTSGESEGNSPASVVSGSAPAQAAGASAATASAAGVNGQSQAVTRGREALVHHGGRPGLGGESEEPLPSLGSSSGRRRLSADAGSEATSNYEPVTSVGSGQTGQPRPTRDERSLEREENQRAGSAQRASKYAEHLRKTEAARSAAGAAKKAQQEQAQERQGGREERQHEREARSTSAAPRKTKEQRREARETARHLHGR
jgi:RNA polymerase sigma factor (sigma-70 family)